MGTISANVGEYFFESIRRQMKPDKTPLVSVIIIHYKGEGFLSKCIAAVERSTFHHMEIIVVNNGLETPALSKREGFFYIKNENNLGFAEGCNVGIGMAKGEYVFILNNDVEISPDCIEILVEKAGGDSSLGILQPKMLDVHEKNRFHSSAAGGMIDILGYPFARGRILNTIEEDKGQYDDSIHVFWVSGAAFFAKRSVLIEAGLFDKDFFLYMEEIDLCWRVYLSGYKIIYVPEAVIYHVGCPNIGRENIMRMYYVHRNSMIMLLKNLSMPYLLILFPVRLILESGILLLYLTSFRLKRSIAILKAFIYIFCKSKTIWTKRREIQEKRKVSDEKVFESMHKKPVLLQYALFGKKYYSRINPPVSKYYQP
ncbi:MAG TPA: glycosyltransferase family 2 protein [Nitrospirae bacterium]|nr:glycosyltransferase family 2 protein [Nitrospirota bacterium]